MAGRLALLIIFCHALLQVGCSKPKATVFKDERLSQEESVKFCLLGDLGMDTAFQDAIANALKREDCDRIVLLGDLVYSSGIKSPDDPELDEKFLKFYSPFLDDDPDLRFLLVLGNHDHQGNPAAWKALYREEERFFFPHYYYFVDYGGLCVVALDTSFYFYKEQLAEAGEQTRWLTGLQPRLKECDVKVAVSHHPFKGGGYPGSKDWKGAEGGLRVFLDTYVIGNFDLHVAGHVHVLEDDGKDEGTRMLISGTGGENRGPGKSGFVVLTWWPSNPKRIGYRLRVVDTQPNVFSEDLQEETEFVDWPDPIEKVRLTEGFVESVRTWLRALFRKVI
jgi:3',5'-cyclic AMP phosphodiesterase CpdA